MPLHSLILKGLELTIHPRHRAKTNLAGCTTVSSLDSISPPSNRAPWPVLSFVQTHGFPKPSAQLSSRILP